MLSYRHAFHAGNHADVLKHAVQSLLLEALKAKDKPFCYIDTHAGGGCYDLSGEWSQKKAEFEDGIARLWDTLASKGIAQTGSYKNEEDSTKPLVIDSPTGGGKLGLVTGTVSLNGMTADHDWQVDRLREAGDPQHQSDIDRAVAKA